MCLLPIASRPVKAMDQLVRFLAPTETDSAVLHLLSAGKEESGADKLTQSAAMVSNDTDLLLSWERYLESENKNKKQTIPIN